MYNREKFDWETREDADTLRRYKEITSDGERLKKAQSCIQDSIDIAQKALGVKPSQPSRRNNPATLGKLKF